MHSFNAAPSGKSGQTGFTLLEVIVALAITGFVLGGLFSLVGGSKQLSWRSEESLMRAMHERAATNFALLQNEYTEVEPILQDESYLIRPLPILEYPVRKTQGTIHALQSYELVETQRDESVIGTRFVELEIPE